MTSSDYRYKSPDADQTFTIDSEDQAKLEQFVKELQDLPAERSQASFDILMNGNVEALIDVLRDDDGVIDVAENQLLEWYINVYLPKSKSNPAYGKEAIGIVYEEIKKRVQSLINK